MSFLPTGMTKVDSVCDEFYNFAETGKCPVEGAIRGNFLEEEDSRQTFWQ